MLKSLLLCAIFCFTMFIKGSSQAPERPTNSTITYHSASTDKQSWQRLNLWLSSSYFYVAKEGQVDQDSCLLRASRYLGLSRLSILAEGIVDSVLLAQSQWIDQRDPAKGARLLSETKGRKHLELLLLLGAYYAFQRQSYYHYRDSVEYFLTKAIGEGKTLSEEKLGRQAFCLLEKMYYQANDLKNGDSIFNRLIKECHSAGDRETEARAFAYRGIYLFLTPATAQDKIVSLQKATEIYGALKNTEGQINVLTDMGYLLLLAGKLHESYVILLQALQLEDSIHYIYVHYNTDAIAMVTIFDGKFGEPLRYVLQSIKVAESTRDSLGLGYFYGRLILLYNSEGGKEKESEEFWRKSFDRFIQDRDPVVYNILNDQINRLNDQGRGREALDLVTDVAKKVPPQSFTDQFFYHMALTICYNELGQFELAKMHLAKADSLETKAEAIRGPLRRAMINFEYGSISIGQGQYRQAKEHYEKYFLDSKGRNLGQDLRAYRTLFKIDSALHDDAAALAHYKMYSLLLDSNFRVSEIRQAEELQVMYQTQEKENQITLLNQQAKLEQASLKQATLTKNVTFAGIVAVFIIAGLLYRQNRLRKKNNIVITHKNNQLQHYLDEKEWLLREIHHRVKNNLQIVMSLLNSQSTYIDNESALTAIHDSQHRVHAMSLIHQKLYGSENVSSIDMSVYIRELVTYLADSFSTGQRIRFEIKIESLEMDVSQAVPLGLILNEAITNSIKYAFPGERSGVISILLSTNTPGHCVLNISDNGIGMPSHFNTKKPGSLGMSLMQGLAEDLNGNFSIENSGGTTIIISFVPDPAVERPPILPASLVLNN